MELVDVVDDFDNVIDTMEKEEAHRRHLFVRIAAVLIFTTRGTVVLQKTSQQKRHNGLYSYSAGGHVQHGETYEQAAHRELFEEIGVKVEKMEYIGHLRSISRHTKKPAAHHHVFKAFSDGPFTPDPEEIESLEEFTFEELKKLAEEHAPLEEVNRPMWESLKLAGII